MARKSKPSSAKGEAGKAKAKAPRPVVRASQKSGVPSAQQRDQRLAEVLAQQTATAEILRVISSSPTDIQPVLDTVVRAAARFCGATDVLLLRLEGSTLRAAAAVGQVRDVIVERTGSLGALEVPVTPGSVTGRAVLERRTVHVHDLASASEDEFPEGRELQRRFGHRTMVATSLLRGGTPLGVIALFRMDVEPFSDKQLELLRAFADQAVIAIENARLLGELQAKNAHLTEALGQQTAMAEILRVISSSPTDLQPVFDTIVQAAVTLCGGACGNVQRFDGEFMHLAAHYWLSPEWLAAMRQMYPRRPDRAQLASRAVLARSVVHMPDVFEDPEYSHDLARTGGFRSVVSVPMLRGGDPIGVITVAGREAKPFSNGQVALLRTFADQAVIAIENVRLFQELEARNRELTETLEQQTATGNILRVISSSPTDVQPVFDAVAASAARLCEVSDVTIFRRDGDGLRLVAHHGAIPVQPTLPLIRGTSNGRAVLDGRTVHVTDMQTEAGEFPEGSANARLMGHRTILCAPLMRDGVAIGTIHLRRTEARRFTERQVALLQTFADQAVIAIENTRLFAELQEKNQALTRAHAQVSEALDQQTATAEILKVISSSPTDVQPVFDAVAASAARLCEAFDAAIFRLDRDRLRLVANHGPIAFGPVGEFSLPVTRGVLTGRVVLEGRALQVADLQAAADEFPHGSASAREWGHRTALGVPMMREGAPIGAIIVRRTEVQPFTERQVALLQTFADQAVIAIENVRLFRELETRNQDLTEALKQQTVTGEVLKLISRSTFDLGPVLGSLIENAVQLCRADKGLIYREDGQFYQVAASYGHTPEWLEVVKRHPIGRDRGSATGRAVLERRAVHIHDILADPEYRWATDHRGEEEMHRTILAVPMLREGAVIGVIVIRRLCVEPFTDKQIDLVTTFADQAVIAVENVRLFTELEARNLALTETLEQQTATGEILRVISSSPTDVQPVFDTIAESAARLCDGHLTGVYRFDGTLIHFVAHHNWTDDGLEVARRTYPRAPSRETQVSTAILDRAVVEVRDFECDPGVPAPSLPLARALGYRSILVVPMLREGNPVGVIAVARAGAGAFAVKQVELLKTFADQAVIAIENVRLFQELQSRNRALTETLEQQTATSEILRVISASPTDVQPVFDTIVRNAVQLCGARFGVLHRFDGERLHLAAHDVTSEVLELLRRTYPMHPSRSQASGRAILTRAVAEIHDVWEDPEYRRDMAAAGEWRSLLAVPMLRADGSPIGTIVVQRSEPGTFAASHIEMLKTFADQAVIAIENVRLFKELETRTQELTRSVGELRALGEVTQAVSSTLDLETVLATIVSRAVQLSGSDQGIVYEFDEATQTFHQRAGHRITAEHLDAVRAEPIRLGDGAMGRAGVLREPVQVADLEADWQLVAPQVRAFVARDGMRSLFALPLVREERLLGGLVILRRARGAFSPEVVAMLQTFATQSVLAIHNARLFHEIQRQKQYSDALVETSPVAIVTLDLHFAVVGWNPGAERLFGYTQAEVIGRPLEDLVATADTIAEVRANLQRSLQGERPRAIARRARKDGTLVDVETSAMPVVVDGVQVGFIVIYHDITELLQARQQAEAANEAKSAFLATMSHEIRTPMNAVIGMSGLLLNTPLTDDQREFAEVVRQSGDALLTVINDILDFSKIEAGKLELEAQPFDLRECVESALDLVAARAAEKGLDLAYLIADEAPAGILGDVTRLRQVLLNLLSNAVKFTEHGEVFLSVSASRLDAASIQEVAFSVRDTGIGIPPDRLGRLFESFTQVDASTTRRYGGTGLGLAISQRLTELMGGRISVTSEVGQGSEFRFTIRVPAAEVSVPARRDLSGVQPSLRDKLVLVVDDNATNRRIVTAHLDAWGMRARATGSPLEAIGWIGADEHFDVGILDMHMPEMDGVALARAIREHPSGEALPLVLFTSLGRREARADSEGFAAYLHKPIKPSQLFDALVSVLAEQPVHVRERGVARSEFDPGMAGRHPLRVLLAEDNIVNQKVALRLLVQMGYRADVAANGLEAIDAVERQTYDVVLMDVQMPELDGFEASREINRRWPGERRPRLVAMTANAMQGDRELCEAAGMDDYVAKPIRIDALVAALERCRWRFHVGARVASAGTVGSVDAPVPSGPLPSGSPDEPHAGEPGRVGPEGAIAGVIDRAVFERLTATTGGTFVAELIDAFVEDARALIATLERASAETDVDAFRRAAHSLKSNGETLGATRLAALSKELEALARAGRLDGVGSRVEELAVACELAVRALGQLRRDLAA